MFVADDTASSRHCRSHPCLSLVVWHGNVDVGTVALEARAVPIRWNQNDGPRRAGRAGPRLPTAGTRAQLARTASSLAASSRIDRHLHLLYGGWFGRDPQLTGRRRNLAGELDVALAQAVDVVSPQAHSQAPVPQVNIWMVVGRVGQRPMASTRETPLAND